jgi:molecular chaperone IbpA
MSLNGGYAMRTFDYAPLYRSTIGFDHLFNLLDAATKLDSGPAYPPYNIERTGENAYKISLAVAGFAEAELEVEIKENLLSVRGTKAEPAESDTAQFLYHGIAGRDFERRFQLADHVVVTGAKLANGLLELDLKREIPEALKPRRISIGGPRSKALEDKALEDKAA